MVAAGVVMGRVVASYGVQGWLKVQPFTAAKDALLAYRQWSLVDRQGATRNVRLKEGKVYGGYVLAALEGVTAREDAAALQGMSITVPREALPALSPGEVYFVDLIGLMVMNREGETLGTVTAVQEYGAQPVLHVAPLPEEGAEGKKTAETLIPFVDAHIDAVELEAGCINVDWQRGD
ncbi:MAG: ribosome maturation factor RimM [Proteobacteria bacterium]|nr:ribosome maturation factor RimM [Pseudomonadota bacterium]MCL2306679.1 ribosome maturation factor RimM [Pseudomonadota bacterium]